MITLKLATKGAALDTEKHEQFDVHRIPYQNLPMAHPLRIAWQEANVDSNWTDDKGKDGVAMRPITNELSNGFRSDSLSYDKLVRQTAVRMHKSGDVSNITRDELVSVLELDKTRLFQNLVAVIGLDDVSFADSMETLEDAIEMFIDDVLLEIPHAQKSAGGGKSKAEIEAEIALRIAEEALALKDEARAFLARAATGENGLPFPAGVPLSTLKEVYVEYRQTLTEKNDEGHDGMEVLIKGLDVFVTPFQTLWG